MCDTSLKSKGFEKVLKNKKIDVMLNFHNI